ncbi:hypothetical protein [Paractinoplanes durhamensis]|uniref:Uncharacterized protein n=1 Tax=Paractinoplanes durhamensis TaxID=113563 RepID=A0ABQ3YTZ2_9ACTN|nr:hypothetical protein [Actinoplanes durhamensis]GIE01066.1 hypothetical protein Adu01nite_24160 [Actinoplanes durhamensis]
MRERVIGVPLLVLLLLSFATACGKSDNAEWASPPGYVPVNGTESPSVASPGAPAAPKAPASPGAAAKPAARKTTRPTTGAPVERTATTPAVRKTAKPRPQLPAGRVPDFLIGTWTGGPGDEKGRYLKISSAGKYERGFSSGTVESSGTVIADAGTATFYDRNGGTEQASLLYTDAAGIVVLSVEYAEQGYYSYVAI